MNPLAKRVERLERGGGDVDGLVHYIGAPKGMSSEEALAQLGIVLGPHDRVSVSTDPSAAPELFGQMPVQLPVGALATLLAEIAEEAAA